MSRIRPTQLQRRCRDLVRSLDIPAPFDLGEFLARLEGQRGREIQLVPMAARPNTPCGMWISTAATDYVFFTDGTSPLHRDHIACHEVGHMLFGHTGGLDIAPAVAASLLPDLSSELITRLLGRTAYGTEEEQEAEGFATFLLQHADRARCPARAAAPHVAAVLANVEHTWGRNL